MHHAVRLMSLEINELTSADPQDVVRRSYPYCDWAAAVYLDEGARLHLHIFCNRLAVEKATAHLNMPDA